MIVDVDPESLKLAGTMLSSCNYKGIYLDIYIYIHTHASLIDFDLVKIMFFKLFIIIYLVKNNFLSDFRVLRVFLIYLKF